MLLGLSWCYPRVGGGNQLASLKNRSFNTVGGIKTIPSYKTPYIRKVVSRLGRELIWGHSRGFSPDNLRFTRFSLERTSSASSNSPRCAAA